MAKTFVSLNWLNLPKILALLSVGAVVVCIFFLPRWPTQEESLGPRWDPSRGLRLQVETEGAYEDFVLGLRVYHYRLRLDRKASYSSVYYDTNEGDLYRNRYILQLSRSNQATGRPKHSLLLERMRSYYPGTSTKLDSITEIAVETGELTTKSESSPIFDLQALELPKHFQLVLAELEVQPGALLPRLIGELKKATYQITDKGRTWFTLDHEEWTFYPLLAGQLGSPVHYDALVVHGNLNEGEPEYNRRTRTMQEFSRLIVGIRPSWQLPHVRAIEHFYSERVSQKSPRMSEDSYQ